ncbi:MAG: 16S rRNA (adenine(1518)-N(6)/adenine(1519)-N(6))-dimethyltransferase RsmA [Chloroflexi bacterium]|nr:16S rRNA (adenine(1518)-N(6)/adenine(1519)-N(6))-dimethyltransferase RsmA [Chloroflexota bacterium]
MQNKKIKNTLKKSLGQHILKDRDCLERIVGCAGLSENSRVLEIGAGPGNLTTMLCDAAGEVIAVELDRDFMERLHRLENTYDNLHVIHADILGLDLFETLKPPGGWAVVANLPYQITTKILLKLLSAGRELFTDLFLTVQKEVGERLCSPPGSKRYGAISVYTYYKAAPEILFDIPAEAFTPPPRVDSCLIRLAIRDKPPFEVEDENFFNFVRACFSQRRKKLANAAGHAWPKIKTGELRSILPGWGFDPSARPETLSPEDFGRLYNNLLKS